MKPSPLSKATRTLIDSSLSDIETTLDADVISFFGEIRTGVDSIMKNIVEELASDDGKHDQLVVILTTPGGTLNPLERMVTIFRHFYSKVIFIVPDYAYSAGTILCMSGDEIWMNYYSALGPIDPQVPLADGTVVPALGYLDKVNEMIDKSRAGELTDAEFLLLRDMDLAKLRAFEQAKELAIDLIEKWLANYKFKDWVQHSDGAPVTEEEKKQRAREIASYLSDNNIWKSHSRPISIDELGQMKLKVRDYTDDAALAELIDTYNELCMEYIADQGFGLFFHTRRHL